MEKDKHTSKKRKKNDGYNTPYSMTSQFIQREKFEADKRILEPACGNRYMIKILRKHFKFLDYYDKYCGKSRNDFLKQDLPYDYIITNPPFSLADQFILKAQEVCLIKFAFLMKLDYLQGKWRYDNIYSKNRRLNLSKVYIFDRQADLSYPVRKDGKYEPGMQTYAWYVFEECNHEPWIRWIDNFRYIIREKDRIPHYWIGTYLGSGKFEQTPFSSFRIEDMLNIQGENGWVIIKSFGRKKLGVVARWRLKEWKKKG